MSDGLRNIETKYWIFGSLVTVMVAAVACRRRQLLRSAATIEKPPCSFPLVALPSCAETGLPPPEVANAVVEALRTSGFLLVHTPLVPLDLQKRALLAASRHLRMSTDTLVEHPSDPKKYAMLRSETDCLGVSADLHEYHRALERTKVGLLRCIACGLGLDPDFLARRHDEANSSMRLLLYPPGDERTANRCKAHSDYGSVTLLLTDGNSGLEAFHNGAWERVPFVEGALVVNVGSLLSDWSNGQLLATLHRVAGPASCNTSIPLDILLAAVERARVSIAYFADPNERVKAHLGEHDRANEEDLCDMTVAEYIEMRSGGAGMDRSGVAFTAIERARIGEAK